MEDQNKEEILEIDPEQLESLMGDSDDKLPPIAIPMEWYNTEEFHRGINESSYESGVITALLNTGVSESFVLDYLLNKETIKHNLESANITKEMNVEISKNQKATLEKQEL